MYRYTIECRLSFHDAKAAKALFGALGHYDDTVVLQDLLLIKPAIMA
jgi:hypothetical protein